MKKVELAKNYWIYFEDENKKFRSFELDPLLTLQPDRKYEDKIYTYQRHECENRFNSGMARFTITARCIPQFFEIFMYFRKRKWKITYASRVWYRSRELNDLSFSACEIIEDYRKIFSGESYHLTTIGGCPTELEMYIRVDRKRLDQFRKDLLTLKEFGYELDWLENNKSVLKIL